MQGSEGVKGGRVEKLALLASLHEIFIFIDVQPLVTTASLNDTPMPEMHMGV